MIAFPIPSTAVRSDNLPAVLTNKNLIKALAQQIIANQAEAYIDMISDAGPKEYTSYDDVVMTINANNLADSAEDYLDDLMAEFASDLYCAIRQCKVKVKSVKITDKGVEDAEVEVE